MSGTNLTSNFFSDLNLYSWLIKQCSELGLEHPTPVQFNCVPKILSGQDCIGISQTGSGKTLAFALPILQKLSEDPYGIFALILTPTRELAFQIAEQFRIIGKPIQLQVSLIVGGMDMMLQGKELLSQKHIVVATPGRLADHLDSGHPFSLKRIKFLVLDEADRLLEGHFSEQLSSIFQALPKKNQTLLFSATMNNMEDLKNISLSDPFTWSDESKTVTVEKLDQRYILTPLPLRDSYLVNVIRKFQEKHTESSIMVFCRTCRSCQHLSQALNILEFKNLPLNSTLSQRERIASLTKFKSNAIKLLITTDVASRGLDIPAVDLVINYNAPSVPTDYVHRVGRTARAGRGGLAVTFVTKFDIKRVHAIEELIKTQLTEFKVNKGETLSIMVQVNTAMREAEIMMDEMDFGEKRRINKEKKLFLQGQEDDEHVVVKKRKKKKVQS